VLGVQAEHDPAGDQQFQPGCGGQQVGQPWRRLQNLLEVVQQEEELPLPQVLLQPIEESPRLGLAHVEGLGKNGEDPAGIAERRQGDEEDTVREVVGQPGGDLEGQPGLTGAAGTGERDQTDVRAPQ
jgi:hypothetical protein